VVKLLWDDEALYAGFDVSDTHVEGSTVTPWDGDSLSVVVGDGEEVREYRHSLLGEDEDDPNGKRDATSKHKLKEPTSFDDPDNPDEGYIVEMQIPWGAISPVVGGKIPADFLSVDHDQNPGARHDATGTKFSKISWDGDERVDTAGRHILLSTSTEPSVTDTPTQTDTPTPPPTEPLVTDTPAPIPECPSFRPPLKGTADFAGDVEIMTPDNCTTGLPTETFIDVGGTYKDIPADVDIWLLVYTPFQLYFPQSPNSCEGMKMDWEDGVWHGPVTLGQKGGEPERFDIVVVLTDQETSQFFSEWHRQGCANGHNYPGIPADELGQRGIIEKAFITVQTQD
jgi:hypothetical protein